MSRPVKNTEHYARIIDSNGTSINVGQQAVGNSISVVTATSHNPPINVSKVGGQPITLGQKGATSAIPVVHSSDIDISMRLAYVGNKAFSLGQVANASSISVVTANSHNVPTNITQVGGSNLSLGTQSAGNSLPVTYSSNGNAVPIRSTAIGTHGNLIVDINGVDLVNAGNNSLAVNCSNVSIISVFGNISDPATIVLQQSQDNNANNWFTTGETFVHSENGGADFYMHLGTAGAKYYRLLYEEASVVNVTGATLAGK